MQRNGGRLERLNDGGNTINNENSNDNDNMTAEERRRYERNQREQQRTHKISHQIKELRTLLNDSKVPYKPNKFSILMSVAEWRDRRSGRLVWDAECVLEGMLAHGRISLFRIVGGTDLNVEGSGGGGTGGPSVNVDLASGDIRFTSPCHRRR